MPHPEPEVFKGSPAPFIVYAPHLACLEGWACVYGVGMVRLVCS